jgi:hypothetical protein
MPQEVDSLTIKLRGKDDDYVTAGSFLEVMRETIAILRGIDAESTLIWKLKKASIDSPLSLTFVAQPRPSVREWKRDVSKDYIRLFRGLENNDKNLIESDLASEKLLLRAKDMLDVLSNGVASVTFSATDRESVTPTQRVQATVDEVVSTRFSRYSDFAILEGDLQTITVRGGTSFFITDRITGREIQCYIPHEQLGAIMGALEKRVSVYGKVKYKSGRPVSIDVETMKIMARREELPQFSDVKGIYPDDGIDSVEQIRSQRNAW